MDEEFNEELFDELLHYMRNGGYELPDLNQLLVEDPALLDDNQNEAHSTDSTPGCFYFQHKTIINVYLSPAF